MPTTAMTKIRGLYDSDSELTIPDGALLQADNVVLRYRDSIEPRPAQLTVGGIPNTETLRTGAFYRRSDMLSSENGLVLQSFTGKLYTVALGGMTSSAYSGTYFAPNNYRMKFASVDNSLIFNTLNGVQWLETPSSTIRSIGVPPGLASCALDGNIGQTASRISGAGSYWFPADRQVAYRFVYGRKLTNGRIILSAPSARTVLINPPISTLATLARTSNVVTATYATPHGLSPGGSFRLDSTAPMGSFPTGVKQVDTVTNPTTLTYLEVGANVVATGVTTYTSNTDLSQVDLLILLPPGVLGGDYFVRVYRSALSANAQVAPDDEMYLVKEQTITAAYTAEIGIQDRTPDSAVTALYAGYPLYTNANTGDGIASANYQPPIAHDVCEWQNRVWYGRITSKQRLKLSLTGVPPDGWTITIAGVTFTARTTPVNFNTDFPRSVSQVSIADNLRTTAASLCNQANQYSLFNNGGFLLYPDESSNTPGGFTVEETNLGGSSFAVTASSSLYTNPTLPTSGTTVSTTTDNWPNGLYFSKANQPEAVPLLNYLRVGSNNAEILRIIPLRERLYVFKQDGIFVVTGSGPFSVDLLDDTAILIAPDTAAVLNGKIHALTTQGVVQVSDAGVGIISRPIERKLKAITDVNLKSVNSVPGRAFAVARENEREYALFMPDATSANCTQAFIYNYLTNAWTRWTTARSLGIVDPRNGTTYFGSVGYRLYQEDPVRPGDYSQWDVPAVSATVTALTTNADGTQNATLTGSFSPAARYAIEKTSGGNYYGASWLSSAGSNGVLAPFSGSSTSDLAIGNTLRFYEPVDIAVRWMPMFLTQPATSKRFREICYHFNRVDGRLGIATMSTEITPAIASSSPLAFTAERKNVRIGVPLEQSDGTMLIPGYSVNEARPPYWRLCGVTLSAESESERNSE